jgi:murein DD-endopeptidase MepM/ murein hydrolase activator NlpD
MRRLLMLVVVASSLAVASPALAQSGGSGAPTGGTAVAERAPDGVGGSVPIGGPAGSAAPNAPTGGARYGRRLAIPPLVRSFSVSPRASFLDGPASRLRFRVDAANARSVHVVVLVRRAGARAVARRLDLGVRRTGRAQSARWSRRGLAAGSYVLSLQTVDARGRATTARVARASLTLLARPQAPAPAPTPGPAPVAVGEGGVFPVQGPFTWNDAFGVPRGTRRHNGQDLTAPAGTPVVSPRAGTVIVSDVQSGGAGVYLVVKDAALDRSYVFMHLLAGSVTVSKGQVVRAGQRLASVGSTGHSTGPHLHFEVWVGGWWTGGHAIDPAPLLRAWSR